MLDWREEPGLAADLPDGVRPIEIDVATAPFDLAATFRRAADGSVLAGFVFDPALFDRRTIEAWGRSFRLLLEGIAAAPETPVDRLPAVALEDLPRAVLTGAPPPPVPALATLLTGALREYGGATALDGPQRAVSYDDLRRLADAWPVTAGDVALIETDDPVERVVGALAAMLRGQAVALIDPALPSARVDQMRAMLANAGDLVRGSEDEAAAAAYVQFTSGSTGAPKAVALPRRGFANLIGEVRRIADLAPGARVIQAASPAFDAWFWEVFSALGAGATLVLADRADLQPGAPLASTLRARRVSHATLTPSAIAAMDDADLPDLAVLIAAGEPLSPDLAARWRHGRRMLNAYGPCEATVCAAYDVCAPDAAEIAIGRPLHGVSLMVIDRHGAPALPGARGELWIAGLGVGLGYLGANDRNAAHFVADPRPGVDGKVYRSGDMARVGADGRVRFVGREDRQVKVRGGRIELDEIEAALTAMPGVTQAAARVVADVEGNPAVAAWAASDGLADAGALRRMLAQSLPETMLPAYLTVLDALPLTATGKVDRQALPDPAGAGQAAGASPEGPTETAIAAAFAELLRLDGPVARDASFFTLGGHSLLAVRLAARLGEALGCAVPLPLLFAHPTPAGLATALAAADGEAPCGFRTLREGAGGTVYLIHSVDGAGQVYGDLATVWPAGRRVVAVEQTRDYDDIESMAAAYAGAIRAVAGAGVIRIGGWSMGARLAAAIARRLRLDGAPVAVALIDAAPTGLAADAAALAEAAADVGADPSLIERVGRNVRLAATRPASSPGGAGVIRAAENVRDGAAADLGWGDVFQSTATAAASGDHMSILSAGPAALAALIERLWAETGDG